MRFCLQTILAALACSLVGTAGELPHPSHTRVALAPKVLPVIREDPRTGQLVRTVTVSPRVVESRVVGSLPPSTVAAPAVPATDVKGLVEQAAKDHDVSSALIESVIQVESNYNPYAVSPKGAQGLMQLMPGTARRFGVTNTFDAKQNIDGGVRYLKFLQDTFGDERLAIAAYNAGEGAVQKYGNVPPYAETIDYVAKVGKKYGQARRAAEAAKTKPAKDEGAPKPPEYRKLTQYVDAEGKVYLLTQ